MLDPSPIDGSVPRNHGQSRVEHLDVIDQPPPQLPEGAIIASLFEILAQLSSDFPRVADVLGNRPHVSQCYLSATDESAQGLFTPEGIRGTPWNMRLLLPKPGFGIWPGNLVTRLGVPGGVRQEEQDELHGVELVPQGNGGLIHVTDPRYISIAWNVAFWRFISSCSDPATPPMIEMGSILR